MLPALAALVPACNTGAEGSGARGSGAEGSALVGTVWRWVRATGAEPLEVDHPGRYTLELRADGRYALRADCNRGSGSYEVEGGRLVLGPGAFTLVACEPGSHADRFVKALGGALAFEQSGERLILELADDAGALELEARRPVALAGTSWLVRAVNNGRQAVVSVAEGTSLDATFGTDGSLAGSAGCNRYSAGFTVEGERIEIAPAATTRMACPPEVMEQESAFLAALGSVATWRIEGERLELRADGGALAVDLRAAVTGTLSAPARQTLPPDAQVRVRLEAVSPADAPALRLGEQRFSAGDRQLPLPFEVGFDPADVDPSRSYAVRAEIAAPDGRVLLRTTGTHAVITRENPTLGIEVTLDPAR